jgi:hypothetical protein
MRSFDMGRSSGQSDQELIDLALDLGQPLAAGPARRLSICFRFHRCLGLWRGFGGFHGGGFAGYRGGGFGRGYGGRGYGG